MTNSSPLLDRYLQTTSLHNGATRPPATVTNNGVSRPGAIPDLDPASRQHLRLVSDFENPINIPTISKGGAYQRWGKRALDLTLAIPLLIMITPVMLLAALVVLLSLGRPILYRQRRVGRDGLPFDIVKLRTMKPEPVIDLRDEEPVLDVVERTTKATRILRQLSLDEFSQLWNVVRGEMSLVGPRPEVWDKALRDDLVTHMRTSVRPGMTGAWQITPARNSEIRHGVSHDLRYIRGYSLGADLRILAATPAAVFRSDTE